MTKNKIETIPYPAGDMMSINQQMTAVLIIWYNQKNIQNTILQDTTFFVLCNTVEPEIALNPDFSVD